MLSVLWAVILGAVLCWVIFLRSPPSFLTRAFSALRGLPKDHVADFVVIGAGPGGLAAAERLLSSDPRATVLVLERGAYHPFAMRPLALLARYVTGRYLLSFAPALVGSAADARLRVHRPLYLHAASAARKDADALQFYPRGRGVEGTAALDWGVWVPPQPFSAGEKRNTEKGEEESEKEREKSEGEKAWAPALRFPALRSPFSWAFAESAAALLRGARHLSTPAAPHRRNAVFPALLRTDAAGRRVSLAPALAALGKERLRVARGCAAVGICVDADGRATSVRCAGACRAAEARRGIVVCGGVVGTPRILAFSNLFTRSALSRVRDAVAVPLVFAARRGVSDDRRRAAHGVCDTIAAVDAAALGPDAELLLAVVPRGGRGAFLSGLHVDRALHIFAEAVTIVVALRGAAVGGFRVSEEGPIASQHPVQQEENEKEEEEKGEGEEAQKKGESKDDHRAKVVAALAEGVRLCRRIVAEAPLAHLTAGHIAVDPALLPCRQRAVEYARLTHTPRAKWNARQRQSAPELFTWAEEVSHTDAYVESYVRRHAVWMGFGSGSSEYALSDPGKSLRVHGTSNVFIGDCSAAIGCKDELRAGSVATAKAMGQAAAGELLRTLADRDGK